MQAREVIAHDEHSSRYRQGRRDTVVEEIDLPEGTEVLVTPLLDEDFWQRASESSLDAVWDNPEDDVYAKLLAELSGGPIPPTLSKADFVKQ